MRTKKKLHLKTVEGLAVIGCTQEEAATVFDMSLSQFKRYLNDNPDIRGAWEKGMANKRVGIRTLQWWHAKQKGPAGAQLTIHLSKVHLGESDSQIVEHRHSGSIAITAGGQSPADSWFKGIEVNRFTDDEAIEFAELCDLIDQLNGAIALLPPEKFQRMTELVRKAQPATLVVDDNLALPPPAPVSESVADNEEVVVIDEGAPPKEGDKDDEIKLNDPIEEALSAVLPPPPKERRRRDG